MLTEVLLAENFKGRAHRRIVRVLVNIYQVSIGGQVFAIVVNNIIASPVMSYDLPFNLAFVISVVTEVSCWSMIRFLH